MYFCYVLSEKKTRNVKKLPGFQCHLKIKFFKHLFTCLHRVFVAALGNLIYVSAVAAMGSNSLTRDWTQAPGLGAKEIMTCGIQSGTLSDASLICHHSLKMGSLCARTLSRFSPTLCDPMDYSPPGSSVNRIFPARILEWVAMPSSRGSSRLRDRTRVSCISCTPSRFFTCEPPTGR